MELGQVTQDNFGPDLLQEEFVAAVKKLNNVKAGGMNGISIEFLKAMAQSAKYELFSICR